ncbi:MAG TPA: spermidine/putrescine ABC transporter substrate-binding protein, partial [Gammaproteobacteria bacterium]|nr:spermidine/putrescine ABC transporter substrate-binding protein [Gammaproteobacteria bacterium]
MRRSMTLFLSLCLTSLSLSLAAGEKTAQKPPALARELYLFNWENYLKPAILEGFKKEFGVRVIEDHFTSNEEMLAKLQVGGGGYDIIVPSDYMVRTLIREARLAPLNPEHLPNLKNIEARFRDPAYDPGNRFSIPYLWGVTGIGYSRKAAMPPPTSWHDLFGPSTLKKYSGRISMLNDMRDALGAALIYLGYSPNSHDPKEIDRAKEVLLRQKPFLAKYDSETYEDSLTAKELVLAQGWSGDFFAAQREDPDIGFVVPKEGAFLFVDNLAIPRDSKRHYTAEVFINYLLRAEVAAQNSSHLSYPTPNAAARALIDPKLDSARYTVPADVKLYLTEDLGPAGQWYERAWTEVKAD